MLYNDWNEILKDEMNKDYFLELMNFINDEYKNKIIYPKYDEIFNSLNLLSYKDVKVVILGQDPYHGENEAHGLAFSVLENSKMPPSLRNIFKELKSDLNIEKKNTNLNKWEQQGVLLLNTVLTVEKDKAFSHRKKGWEIFTDKIIEKLSEKEKVIFILWGNSAKEKVKLIDKRHVIITSAHPSPLSASRGFLGSKPFSKINENLEKKIDWSD
ncbi:MAG: uracil-DNA glycosylase [Mycoplasmatota bacterium]